MYFLGFFCPFLRFTSCIFGQTPTRRQTAQSALLDYSTELISKHILVFYLIAVTKLNNVDRFWNLIYINYTKLHLFKWHSIYALVFIYAKHIFDDFLIIILNFKQSSSYSFFLTTKHWGWGTHTIVHTHTLAFLYRYSVMAQPTHSKLRDELSRYPWLLLKEKEKFAWLRAFSLSRVLAFSFSLLSIWFDFEPSPRTICLRLRLQRWLRAQGCSQNSPHLSLARKDTCSVKAFVLCQCCHAKVNN